MNLTELQKADPDTYNEIRSIFGAVIVKEELRPKIADDIIQGCLQRAIEKRGWGFALHLFNNPNRYSATIIEVGGSWHDSPHSNSPAEALLAAYLEAIHE